MEPSVQVDVDDCHGNTLLSEAAAGGSAQACSLLLELGAHPNSQGEFQRTPLWRAAFSGQAEAVGALLAGGGDPRIECETGETPVHVAATASIKQQLQSWDIKVTERAEAAWQQRKDQEQAQVVAQRTAAAQVRVPPASDLVYFVCAFSGTPLTSCFAKLVLQLSHGSGITNPVKAWPVHDLIDYADGGASGRRGAPALSVHPALPFVCTPAA